jgi:hypothetical protein
MNGRRSLAAVALALAACRPPCGPEPPAQVARRVDLGAEKTVKRRQLTVDDVPRLLWQVGSRATFAPTTLEERQLLTGLVPRLLTGAAASPVPDPAQWQPEAVRAGMRLETWELGGGTYWALLEADDARRGAGAYVFRVGAVPEDDYPAILLEAPHADHDVGSGDIAASLFFAPAEGKRPRALFVNSIHRYQVEPGRRQKRDDNPADAAHNPEHLFSAMTDAVAAALGDLVVLQIHGFADAVDESDDARVPAGTLAVVSAGTRAGSTPTSSALAAELSRAFGPGVRRFPEDVLALGATTNAQGRLLAARKGARFVHVELSADLRKSLRASKARMAELAKIVAGMR